MKKYRVLKTLVKSKLTIDKFFNIFKEKKNPIKERRDKETGIMVLLTNNLSTEQSIELYNTIERKFKTELERRKERAISEIDAITVFTSEDNSFEKGATKNIAFENAIKEPQLL